MQSSSSWFLVAVAALAATQSVNSVTGASTAQCSSVETCYEGGATATACTISNGACPPCVTFADNGCYVKVNGACPFGVDCASVWGGLSPSTSGTSDKSSSSTTSTSDGPSNSSDMTSSKTTNSSPATDAGTPSDSTPSTSGTTNEPPGSMAHNTSGGSEPSSIEVSKSGGSDMSVVFAIIGAAIGVIAVAVIFLTLVRRSKAAHDDDEDEMTPPTFSKGSMAQPRSTTGAAMYSSYSGSNQTNGMNSCAGGENGLDASKGVSMNAVSYYNQQPPHTSAAPSPHVAGRAIPSQPVGMNSSTNIGRSYGGNQNFGTSGVVGVSNGFGASGVGSSGVGVNNQTLPTAAAAMQHVPKAAAPSPHTRRESYEF